LGLAFRLADFVCNTSRTSFFINEDNKCFASFYKKIIQYFRTKLKTDLDGS
jgi:hypothetical protein